jgi:hypothetical protein
MIRLLRKKLAQRRLAQMVRINRNSFETRDYAKRRASALLVRKGV